MFSLQRLRRLVIWSGIPVLVLLASPCCSAELESSAASDGPALQSEQRDALRQLAWSQFHRGVTARDSEHDSVKAAHCFMHAGLNAAAAGERQLTIDASHAAQDVVSAVEFSLPHQAVASGIAVSPSEDLLCSWSYEGRSVHVWSLRTGEHVRSLALPAGVGWASFHPAKRRILIGAWNLVVVWPFDLDEPAGQFNPLEGTRRGTIPDAVFHPDGEFVIASGDKVVWQWKLGSQPEVVTDPLSKALLGSVSRRLRTRSGVPALVTHVDAQRARVWDSRHGIQLRTVGCNGPILQTLLNPRTRQLLTWHGTPNQSTTQVWSLDADQTGPVHGSDRWKAPGRAVLSPDGKFVAAWGEGAQVFVGYSKDSNRPIVLKKSSEVVKIWSASGLRRMATLTHNSPVTAVQIDPTSEKLATAAPDGTISLWSLKSVEEGKAKQLIQ